MDRDAGVLAIGFHIDRSAQLVGVMAAAGVAKRVDLRRRRAAAIESDQRMPEARHRHQFDVQPERSRDRQRAVDDFCGEVQEFIRIERHATFGGRRNVVRDLRFGFLQLPAKPIEHERARARSAEIDRQHIRSAANVIEFRHHVRFLPLAV
ncbi:MAG: hypothetical protein R2845_01545 [Thermomicrobiales bacterium]